MGTRQPESESGPTERLSSRWDPLCLPLAWLALGLALVVLAPGCTRPSGARALPSDFQFVAYQSDTYSDGDQVAFSSLFTDGKPVVLNFWGGLCPPCRVEMPAFQRVYQEYDKRLVMFGLDVGPFTFLGSTEDARALLDTLHISYPTGTLPRDQAVAAQVLAAYEIQGLPVTVFLTQEGEVYRTWTGVLDEERLEELVQELLAL